MMVLRFVRHPTNMTIRYVRTEYNGIIKYGWCYESGIIRYDFSLDATVSLAEAISLFTIKQLKGTSRMTKVEKIYQKGLKALDDWYERKETKCGSSGEYLKVREIHTPKIRRERESWLSCMQDPQKTTRQYCLPTERLVKGPSQLT
jgi:hypothetical protein